ncbi:hypothetical protein ANTQUA_LOCUS6574 [Anthophora quadrimaculata]
MESSPPETSLHDVQIQPYYSWLITSERSYRKTDVNLHRQFPRDTINDRFCAEKRRTSRLASENVVWLQERSHVSRYLLQL